MAERRRREIGRLGDAGKLGAEEAEKMMERVKRPRETTKTRKAAPPDKITWSLRKFISKTNLEKPIIKEVAKVSNTKAGIKTPRVVGDDHVHDSENRNGSAEIREWRPIVRANTVGNRCGKIVALELPEQEQVWHPLRFAGRKGRGAINSVIMMDEQRKEAGGEV